MKNKIINKGTLIISVLVLALTLVTSSTVIAQDEGNDLEFQADLQQTQNEVAAPVPGGPGFVSIHSSAFDPQSNTYAYTSGFELFSSHYETAFFYADLNLPHGSIIKKVVFYYNDTNPNHQVSLRLYQKSFDGSANAELTFLVSSGSGGYGYAESPELAIDVDNQINSYNLLASFTTNPGSTVRLVGVRIDYGYPGYLPLINK